MSSDKKFEAKKPYKPIRKAIRTWEAASQVFPMASPALL